MALIWVNWSGNSENKKKTINITIDNFRHFKPEADQFSAKETTIPISGESQKSFISCGRA